MTAAAVTRTLSSRSSNEPTSAPLSPEVEAYLEARGYVLPAGHAVPLWRTPEPRDVPGAMFDFERVDRVIKAIGALRHTKGRWAGTPIVLSAIQVAYIVAPIFGWVHRNAQGNLVRIVQEAYIEMPRKGAKTTLAAALGFYLAFADGEAGAEVIFGAGSRDQAGQAFKPLAALVKSSPLLQRAGIVATKRTISQDVTSSVISTASSRGDLSHGANVHGGLVDELHVHKDDSILEAIESGTGAREQPLVTIITTADDGQTTSVYAQRRRMIEQVCQQVLDSPATYGVIFALRELDQEDDIGFYFTEEAWQSANPLYPITPNPEFMAKAADKAKANPVALASYLRLHLGIRAKQAKRFFDLARWDASSQGPLDEASLEGEVAFGGLDLGNVSDLTALSWLFPYVQPDGTLGYRAVWRLWVPESAMPGLDAATNRNASAWVREGWLTVTPGDVTDYNLIQRQIEEDADKFNVQSIGYDRWNSSQLVINLLENGIPMEKVSQGVNSLSAPLKEMSRQVLLKTFDHGGNPVLRWMADNLRVYADAGGNIKPDKAKSMDKIDGIAAALNALFLAMNEEADTFVSAYETGEVEEV